MKEMGCQRGGEGERVRGGVTRCVVLQGVFKMREGV